MGWIESYKSKGQRYYRYLENGEKPIHLGTAVQIVRKVRAEEFAERKLVAISPTEIRRGREGAAHGNPDSLEKAGFTE